MTLDLAADLARMLDPLGVAHALGLELDGWQADLLTSTHSRILICAGRQVGKSTATSCVACNTALSDGGLILCASPSLRQSSELFRKILVTLRSLTPPVEFVLQSATHVELQNGARIVSLPGSEQTIRGFSSPRLILLDEAARTSDDVLTSLRPMLATGEGRLIALSTPHGMRGWFYEAFVHGGVGWERYKVPANSCPRITAQFLAEELRELGPTRYASEYECTFTDVDEQFFASALIERALSADVVPLWS